MRRSLFAVALIGGTVAIASCTTSPEAIPPEAANAPSQVPAEKRRSFDLFEQARVATRACLESEINGPLSLRSLLADGYTVTRGLLGVKYEMVQPYGGLFDRVETMAVHDSGDSYGCQIEVPRDRGYEVFAVVADEVTRLGYRRIEIGRYDRYVGNGRRFDLRGSYTRTSLTAQISIYRITAYGDRSCRRTDLPADFMEGC